MSMFNANLVMRELRKAKGLTQEQLAEGICSRSAIAMIEKGERKPDWYIFSEAMRKMGVDPKQFYTNIISSEEATMYSYYMEMYALYKSRNVEGMKVELEKMENDKRFSEGFGRKIYLDMSRMFYVLEENKNKNPELSIEYAMKLLRMTRPDFDIDKINEYYLSNMEVAVVAGIATAYAELRNIEKAIEIRQMTIKYYENNHVSAGIYEKMAYVISLTNLADNLLSIKAYDNCIEVCDKSLKFSFGLDFATVARMKSLYFKSFALGHLGQKEESEHLFKQYLFYCWGVAEHLDVTNTTFDKEKKRWEETFGYKLDLTLPW